MLALRTTAASVHTPREILEWRYGMGRDSTASRRVWHGGLGLLRVVADLCILGLWALFVTLFAFALPLPWWVVIFLLLFGVALYVRVTVPWLKATERG